MRIKFGQILRPLAYGVAAATLCGGALAQTFTFQSTSEEPTTVGATTPEGSVAGAYWTGASTVTMADGSVNESTFTCVSTSQPPRDSIFMVHGVCDGTGADGDYTVYSGCNIMDPEAGEMSCVGGLIGKSGNYAGRRGVLTIHSKGGASAGTGQWFE
ncbi:MULTISPECIES: hypothetical protein [Hyphomonas]|nr:MULTISPECIES: hypothetical protein [Hyphomonas]HAE27385.1 hypothetical protein [Hyphomonas adhaerens]